MRSILCSSLFRPAGPLAAAGLFMLAIFGNPAAKAADLGELVDLHFAAATGSPLPGAATRGLPLTVAATPGAAAQDGCPALLQQTFTRLQGGAPQSLCQFSGKVLLVVNTASYCGFTHQYEGLEALYRKYRDRGLVVIGFPSNDFFQEPGSNQQVEEFCRTTYGVQFPMFEKGTVTKLTANPFYSELAKRSGQAPKWNFHKYVVDRSGREVRSFGSSVEPDDKAFVALIETMLAARSPGTPS